MFLIAATGPEVNQGAGIVKHKKLGRFYLNKKVLKKRKSLLRFHNEINVHSDYK